LKEIKLGATSRGEQDSLLGSGVAAALGAIANGKAYRRWDWWRKSFSGARFHLQLSFPRKQLSSLT
jgi:hypothetical protein